MIEITIRRQIDTMAEENYTGSSAGENSMATPTLRTFFLHQGSRPLQQLVSGGPVAYRKSGSWNIYFNGLLNIPNAAFSEFAISWGSRISARQRLITRLMPILMIMALRVG
jgi:hypothetical protein